MYRVEVVYVAQEMGRNEATAKYVAWPSCAWLLLRFFPFPVRHPLCKIQLTTAPFTFIAESPAVLQNFFVSPSAGPDDADDISGTTALRFR